MLNAKEPAGKIAALIHLIYHAAEVDGREVVVHYDVQLRRLMVVDVPTGYLCCHICLGVIGPLGDEPSTSDLAPQHYRSDVCCSCAMPIFGIDCKESEDSN